MYYFGIDIGGTYVKIGVFDEDEDLINQYSFPTKKDKTAQLVLNDIIEIIDKECARLSINYEQIAGIGIGIAGIINEQNVLVESANLCWKNINLIKDLQSKINVKNIKIENDCNVALLGEMFKGSANGCKNAVMLTIGTGIGGSITIDEKLLKGSTMSAGEIGHITVDYTETEKCNCGKKGCLEQYASATGIVKQTIKLLSKSDKFSLLKDYQNITAKDVFDCANKGDEIALEIVKNTGELIGRACATISQILDPNVIVVGGGVSLAGDILINTIRKSYKRNVLNTLKNKKIVVAQLGGNAGIYGAYCLVHKSLQ